MSGLIAFVGGGISEAIKYLQIEISREKFIGNAFYLGAAVCFAISCVLVVPEYYRYKKYK